MPKYISYDEMMEILDNKYLLPFRKDERLRGLNGIDIVRCGECKRVEKRSCPYYAMGLGYTDDDFCSYGERKDDE